MAVGAVVREDFLEEEVLEPARASCMPAVSVLRLAQGPFMEFTIAGLGRGQVLAEKHIQEHSKIEWEGGAGEGCVRNACQGPCPCGLGSKGKLGPGRGG